MTLEQFNALVIMVQQMVYCEAERREYMHASLIDSTRFMQRAQDAGLNSGKAIEQARALLVEQPAKEIVAPANSEKQTHYHMTEITGLCGVSSFERQLPCNLCSWGH